MPSGTRWKLFILYRQPRGGLIPKKEKLVQRFEAFGRGEWATLIEASRRCDVEAAVSRRRRRRRGFDELERRAARAEMLVGLGELSSARQALEGADLAPGTENTKRLLTDRNKRPPELLDSIPTEVANNVPPVPVALDEGHHFSKLCQPVLVASAWSMHFRGICEVNPNHLVHRRGQCVRYSVLAMLDGLHTLVGSEALPFVHMFHGTPSSYAWESSSLPVWIFMWQFLPMYASLQEHLQSCARISIHRCGTVQE